MLSCFCVGVNTVQALYFCCLRAVHPVAEDEEEDIIRCICGVYRDEGVMIQCEQCFVSTSVTVDWFQVCVLVGRLMSQQHACVFQRQVSSDNFMCCHTEVEVADQTFYHTQ